MRAIRISRLRQNIAGARAFRPRARQLIILEYDLLCIISVTQVKRFLADCVFGLLFFAFSGSLQKREQGKNFSAVQNFRKIQLHVGRQP
jgi:hypothetical protein